MTIGAIPWTAAHRWARAHGVLARERFEHLIRRMDDAYLAALHADDKKPKQEGLSV